MLRASILLLLAGVASCASTRYEGQAILELQEGPVEPPPAENVIEEGCHPTPHTANEIRDALWDVGGRYYRLHGDPESSMIQFIFQDVTESTCEVETMFYDLEGLTSDVSIQEDVPWTQLQLEGSFRKDEYTLGEANVHVEAGRFDCWVYTMETTFMDREGATAVSRSEYYFAKELPGPPVYIADIDESGEARWAMELYDFNPID